MSAQNIATSLISLLQKHCMKSVSREEISESLVFHFWALFIFHDMQIQV